MQSLLVALIVSACAGYALWVLMPAALRRAVARRLGREAPSGCGACGGCGPQPAAGTAQPIRVHRTRP